MGNQQHSIALSYRIWLWISLPLGLKELYTLTILQSLYQENEAFFTTDTKTCELMTGWLPQPSKHVVTADIPQEALMVREFANLVGAIKNDSKPEKKWPIISRKTQLVLDAVKASIDKGFKPVDVVC
ncbi:hypothetical protein L484_016458 [Morus notabilis]|uniref:Oxidoreductase n=1 Tax=Morus notabilis TaxID=981085 RepID=W9R827_9ROSA|nr:hypothetical protein L484_016458 [Morus notabilis]